MGPGVLPAGLALWRYNRVLPGAVLAGWVCLHGGGSMRPIILTTFAWPVGGVVGLGGRTKRMNKSKNRRAWEQ